MSDRRVVSRGHFRKRLRYSAPFFFWGSLIPIAVLAILYPISYFNSIQYMHRKTPGSAIKSSLANPANCTYYRYISCWVGTFNLGWCCAWGPGSENMNGIGVNPARVFGPRRPIMTEQLIPYSLGSGHVQVPMWYIGVPFIAAMFMLRHLRRFPQQGFCNSCGFDLYQLDSPICPECGKPVMASATVVSGLNHSIPCPECLNEVHANETACSSCGVELDPEQTKWAAFHARPVFLPGGLGDLNFPNVLTFLCLGFRPAALWKRVVMKQPPSLGFSVVMGVLCVVVGLLVMALASGIDWGSFVSAGPRQGNVPMIGFRVSAVLTSLIAFMAPLFCIGGITLLSKRARQTSDRMLLVCYLAAMPILVTGAVVSLLLSFLPDPIPLMVLGAFLIYWTYAVRYAFKSYGPVRSLARWIVPGHVFGILVGPAFLVALTWGIAILQDVV